MKRSLLSVALIVLCALIGASHLRADVTSLQAALNAAQGSVVLSDGAAAPKEIVLTHTIKAGEIHWTLTNQGTKPVRISEVVLFDAPHTLPAETRLYGEGFTMLSQTAGTFAKPQKIGVFLDHKHYRIPAPQGLFTVYNMLSLAPEGDKRLLLAFTSSHRFAGRISFDSERLRVSQDLENLELPPGKSFTLESMSIDSGEDREALLDQLARRLNNNHPPLKHSPIPCGWSSWICFGPSVTSKDVASNSTWIKQNLPALKYVQIDDGYQPWMGDWLDTGKAFGGGVQNVLKQIRADGLEPALWVAPFVASPESKLFQEHPDWFMKDADGKPLRSDKVTFGGWRLGPWYALDATHPDVQKWLEETFRTMTRDWGVTYFKLDANYWGAMHGAKLHDPTATRIEAYRRGMQAILRGTGNSFILGCNHPLWPSLGLIHGSRSSMDVARSCKSFTDTGRENLYRSWQNGKIWTIDPDSLLLGDANSKDVMGPDGKPVTTGKVTFDNLLFHATLLRATGGMLLSSDDLPKLTPNLVSILRKAVPPTKRAFRFSDESFTIGRLTDGNTEWIALLNWDDVPVKRVIEFNGKKQITEYWTDKDLGSHEGTIEIPAMPPRSGMLLKLESFPTGMECAPQSVYRHRPDGQPGREIKVKFIGGKLHGAAELDIAVAGMPMETVHLAVPKEITEQSILLPPGVAVEREAQVSITIRSGKHAISNTIMVPPQRQWTVYLLPHSHVDIGFTNTHENVEFIHKRNIMEAIKLAKETAHYPPEARFRWDTEVSWPAERLLATGTDEEKKAMLDAIRSGIINVGASYINDNTSVSADAEFAALFGPSKQIGKLTGKKFDTLMQVDIPGMSWGVVPAAAMHGIPYVLIFNNGADRTGLSMELSHRPFWWIGPDGISKVLCIQPGSYVPGALLKGRFHWPAMMGQTDRSKLPAVIKTDNPRANFIDGYLWKTLASLEKDPLYPYDIFPMSWAMADNMPVDADVPHAVKSWNEDYAYPKIVIASSHDIMAAFDKQYGSIIPTRTGEFTEYWSDGLGSAAKQTAMNRNAKERLIQADTLWSMLRPGQPAPRSEFDEAWRNVLMGSEHTWCYSDPKRQPLTNDILKVKFNYFQSAHDRSEALLAEALKPTAAPQSKTITVFNTLSWPRTGLVTLPEGITGLKGVPVQTLSTGETVFLAKDVPALGVRSYIIGPMGPIGPIGLISPTTLDNGIVKVTLDPATGNIISLIRDGIEYAKGPLNSYHYLKGAGKPQTATSPSEVKISIKENGPVLASLLVESKADGCKWLRREVRLLAGQPQVEIINTLDKTATTTKEGVHFGFAFDIPQPRARMDIPWGVAEVDADFFPEANRNWICFQRWLDISNAERGITWTSLDAPTFQSGAITANIIGAAVNSPAWIRKLQPSSSIYSWALNNHWHTNFPLSQEGVLTFRYGMLPHNAGYNAAAANRFGLEQARPLICAPTQDARSITPPVTIDNPNVVISSIETTADGQALDVTLRSLSDRQETIGVTTAGGSQKSLTLPPNGVCVDRVANQKDGKISSNVQIPLVP